MIAVVDDEESVRKALVRLLQAAGYPARGFASGQEFLESWAGRPTSMSHARSADARPFGHGCPTSAQPCGSAYSGGDHHGARLARRSRGMHARGRSRIPLQTAGRARRCSMPYGLPSDRNPTRRLRRVALFSGGPWVTIKCRSLAHRSSGRGGHGFDTLGSQLLTVDAAGSARDRFVHQRAAQIVGAGAQAKAPHRRCPS